MSSPVMTKYTFLGGDVFLLTSRYLCKSSKVLVEEKLIDSEEEYTSFIQLKNKCHTLDLAPRDFYPNHVWNFRMLWGYRCGNMFYLPAYWTWGIMPYSEEQVMCCHSPIPPLAYYIDGTSHYDVKPLSVGTEQRLPKEKNLLLITRAETQLQLLKTDHLKFVSRPLPQHFLRPVPSTTL